MRILVTGAGGLLGLNLAFEALEMGHAVSGVDRFELSRAPFKLLKADLLEADAVKMVLDASRPEWLIHCAALADLEACEADPVLARRLNADLAALLATACRQRSVRMLHISTDSVFDGTGTGYYTESDLPNPLGVYAGTKLQGEQAVLEADPDAVVVRVNFYGFSLSGRRSLAEFFLTNLLARNHVNGFTDVAFCPTFVGDLAGVLFKMLEKGMHGLYHAVGAECMSKYDFGVALARRFNLDEHLISPCSVESSGLTARRAHNLRLSIQKLTTHLGESIPSFSTGLDQFYTQYQQGYPQKIRSYQQG